MQNYFIESGGNLRGQITAPGDKSISHRAIMMAAIAEGTTTISGLLTGEDCRATIRACRALGVKISDPTAAVLSIEGVGLKGLRAARTSIDLGNSGTSMRLLAGLLAGQSFASTLTGDFSLRKRPMARIVNPLRQMGAHIEMINENFPPLQIIGSSNLRAINYVMPLASAQVKSGLLLAGLYAEGDTSIFEPVPTRDHTEKLLELFGCEIIRRHDQIILKKPAQLTATHLTIPADISSAAFFMVGALIASDSDLRLQNIGINPTRTGIITLLQMMGADIKLTNQRSLGNETVADIHVKSSRLKGIEIPAALVPLAIDEFPALFIAAACAEGKTVLRGAAELRVKESNRIQVMANGLNKLGINTQILPDGIIIEGGKITSGEINSEQDHRVCMAFAVAGLAARARIIIHDCANVATSFPNFTELAQQIGLKIKSITENDWPP